MKERKFAYIFVAVLAGVLLIGTAVLAAWNASEYAINFLSMSSFKVSIQEEYQRPEHVDPGQKVTKKVSIKNQGDADSFVRVRIQRVFGKTDKNGIFTENKELDPELIEVHYNTDLWKPGKDGYWYYKDVLRAGTITRKPLLDSFYLSEKADNRYKNKEARIIVSLESIQADKEEMKAIWGVDEKFLGITYQPCICETVTSVTLNKEHKLTVEGENGNLFADFQNLQPGCARSQTISVYNETDEEVLMQLHAEPASQKKMNSEKLKMVQQLLTKYATIEISKDGRVLYQGTADGNFTGEGQSMKENISLGKFKAGERKKLVVKLSLSPQMDNKYEKLLAKVKWVFSAKKADSSEEKNGENENKENGSQKNPDGGGAGAGENQNNGGTGAGENQNNGGTGTGENQNNGGNGTGENQNNGEAGDGENRNNGGTGTGENLNSGGTGENSNNGETGAGENGNNGGIKGKENGVLATAAISPKTGDETVVWFKWLVLITALFVMYVCGRRLHRKEN